MAITIHWCLSGLRMSSTGHRSTNNIYYIYYIKRCLGRCKMHTWDESYSGAESIGCSLGSGMAHHPAQPSVMAYVAVCHTALPITYMEHCCAHFSGQSGHGRPSHPGRQPGFIHVCIVGPVQGFITSWEREGNTLHFVRTSAQDLIGHWLF